MNVIKVLNYCVDRLISLNKFAVDFNNRIKFGNLRTKF
jgi:hypothetical protein